MSVKVRRDIFLFSVSDEVAVGGYSFLRQVLVEGIMKGNKTGGVSSSEYRNPRPICVPIFINMC